MTLPEARRTFASLMAKSRERGLTEPDRRRLAQSRQLLRRAKRPAMNPEDRGEFFYIVRTTTYPSRYLTRDGLSPHHVYSKKFATYEDARKAGQKFFRGTKTLWQIEQRDDEWLKPTSPGKPLRNPKKRGGRYHSLEPQIFESMAYRGYLIKFNALRNEYWIEKDRAFISYAPTITGAKKIIDELVGENPRRRTLRNPIELGYRSRKTGRGRHVSIGLERSQRSNPRRRVTRLGRALEVRYKREIGGQPGYYKHAIKSKRAGVYAIPPGWVYVGTKSVLITEKEPHV